MRNRFILRIKSGEIASIPALKTEFKLLAKIHHPDLRGTGAESAGSTGYGFVELRSEYEIALRNFELHRFGFRPPEGPGAFDPDGIYSTLGSLLKRGFPKQPRHEKEKQRYEYLRYLARKELNAAGEGNGGLFEPFERELGRLKLSSPRVYREAVGLLRGIIDSGSIALPELATANAIAYAGLERELGRANPIAAFFAFFMGKKAIG